MNLFLKIYHQKILDYSLALLVFFIPLSPAIPNILIIPAGLVFIYKTILFKRINLSVFWILSFSLLALSLALSILQQFFIEELNFQKEFIAGLAVLLILSEASKIKLIELSFVAGTLLAIIINTFHILFQVTYSTDLDFSVGGRVYELLFIHRPYFAFLTVLTNLVLYKWIRNGESKYYYIIALISASFCFFITAKLGMLLHTFLIFHHIFKSFKKLRPKHLFVVTLICLCIGLVTYNNPYLKERLRIESNVQKTFKKFKAYEIRFIIWDCSFETLKDHWMFGVQSHDSLIPQMTNCYMSKIEPGRTKKINYYKTEKFNTHNQFLDIWLIAGIPGVLMLLSLFIIPFLKPRKYKDMITILTLFFLFMMVENIFQRQMGCFLFGIFLGLYAPREIQWSWSK